MEAKYLYTKNCKTLKKTKINGKLSHIHELAELILFKYPYYAKPSINSLQS